MISQTGAIGVMQVEPYTGHRISQLLGRTFNLYNIDDNIHGGVYWLTHLLNFYGWNVQLAVAAYYQGTRSLAAYGAFSDTQQYVQDVLSLQSQFGG
jgi:soluble lytic murein transglycosylase-like protein